MANNLRVNATVGEINTYSVKKLANGEYIDTTAYSFNWYISGNTTNEIYGSIMGANTHESVQVVWKQPAPTEPIPYADRTLICEVEKLDIDGNVIGCQEVLKLFVSLTVPTLNLNLDYFKGINDDDTIEVVNVNTGEIRFKNQCHIQGNVMKFTVKGDANTKYIKVELKDNSGQSSTNSSLLNGIFLDQNSNPLTDNQLGFYEYDVTNNINGAINVFIKFINKPFSDGFYWVRACALDSSRTHCSDYLYLKFKLLRDGVTIQPPSTYRSEILLGEAAINFEYKYTLVHEIPSWFKIDSYYEVGQIKGNDLNADTDGNYTGDHWGVNDNSNRIFLDSKTVSEITLENQQYYTVSTSLTFPDVFIPQQFWQPGTSPDHFKVKIFGEIYDPRPTMTSCYALKDNIQSQTVKISYCNPSVEFDAAAYKFEAPKCPDPPQCNDNYLFVPQITIPCPPEKTFNYNSGTCVWNSGATGPCNNIPNMSWNGSTCVCPTGYHFDLVSNQCVSDVVNCYGITSISSMTTTCQSLKCLENYIDDSYLNCVSNNTYYYQDIRDYWEKDGCYYYKYTSTDLDLTSGEHYINLNDIIYFCKTNSTFYDISNPLSLASGTYYGQSGRPYLSSEVKYRIGKLGL